MNESSLEPASQPKQFIPKPSSLITTSQVQGQPAACLQTLPLELKFLIIQYLTGATTLYALRHSCAGFYHALPHVDNSAVFMRGNVQRAWLKGGITPSTIIGECGTTHVIRDGEAWCRSETCETQFVLCRRCERFRRFVEEGASRSGDELAQGEFVCQACSLEIWLSWGVDCRL